ncbi:hypothetical protein LCGC14_2033630 [marine sediment metagenome]|uniref:Peptidase S49 domain-containing protein n=1 Tax=marine sediment metagenome TaxID=412755 RepID=A0A0F9H7F4_9ZZZZ
METDCRSVLTEHGTIWAIVPERLWGLLAGEPRQEVGAAKVYRQRFGWVTMGLGEDRTLTADVRVPRLPKSASSIGVLPLLGVITQRDGFWGTSTEAYGQAFDDLMQNDRIGAVVLEIDSPGGSVYGVGELAEKIRSARGQGKPIVAVANSLAASAAYWIGSQADQFIVTPGGEAGSIGVFSVHFDQTEWLAKEGVKVTITKVPEFKAEGYLEPLSEAAQEAERAAIEGYYDQFVDAVAAGRNVSRRAVREEFGKGRVFRAEQAVESGMADRVATLEEVLVGMAKTVGGKRKGASVEDAERRIRVREAQ